MTDADGWKGPKPHHHMINVTVCGAWWSGKPDEHGIPHTMCADGTPNGYTVMHFDGNSYLLDYRAARRGADEQIRITAPEVVQLADAAMLRSSAPMCSMRFPDAVVEWRLNDDDWQPMQKTANETDPVFQALFDEEQPMLPDNLPWRKLHKPMVCPHLWKGTLTTAQRKRHAPDSGACHEFKRSDSEGERIIRIE